MENIGNCIFTNSPGEKKREVCSGIYHLLRTQLENVSMNSAHRTPVMIWGDNIHLGKFLRVQLT